VTITPNAIIESMTEEEVPGEMKEMINSLEHFAKHGQTSEPES
jgi:hypothetical protein